MQQQAHLGSVKEMTQVLGVSRSGYYRYCQTKQSQRQEANDPLTKAINVIHHQSRQTYRICEHFHRTMKQAFYDIAFRKKLYHSLDELQIDVNEWLRK